MLRRFPMIRRNVAARAHKAVLRGSRGENTRVREYRCMLRVAHGWSEVFHRSNSVETFAFCELDMARSFFFLVCVFTLTTLAPSVRQISSIPDDPQSRSGRLFVEPERPFCPYPFVHLQNWVPIAMGTISRKRH